MAQRKKALKTKGSPQSSRAAPAAASSHARALALVQEATRLHVARQLKEAEAVYRQALAIENNPIVLHNLGAALRDLKRSGEAAKCFREALRLKPDYADALSNLGYCHLDAEDYAAAESSFDAALALKPTAIEALSGRGTARSMGQNQTGAEADYKAVLALAPRHVPTLNNFGHMLRTARRYDEAVAFYQKATETVPTEASIWANLGGTLLDMHRLNEAVEPLKKSLELRPDLAASYGNLGTIYVTLGRLDEAVACHRKAVELEPDDRKNHVNLGASLKEMGKLGEAAKSYQRAIEIKPDYDYAINNLGNLSREQGRITDAIACFRQAIAISPDYLVAYSNLLFCLNSLDEFTPAEICAEHRRFGEKVEREAPPPPVLKNNPAPERPLRIGYVSPDFLGHSVAYFIENLLEHHDRRNFHITCYALNKRSDSMTRRLQQRADRWRPVSITTDDQLCEQIIADEIDILVDLAGHTANNRLTAFARRPAPVQATYLGYPNTTGLKVIDYRLTDGRADPPGESDAVHTEKLLRLPKGFLSYRPSDFAPEVAPRPFAKNGYVTFGSFNTLAKATDKVVATWSRLLKEVPNSHLMLKSNAFNDPATVELYHQRFAAHGIAPERLELMGRTPMIGDHLAMYGKIDIALDPFPYNGTTTTCEALWMGVPIVTINGDRHAARVGSSLLHQVGLAELVATDPDDYVARAVVLANDPQRLSGISARLRPDMARSSIMDGPGFARDIEALYRTMWREWSVKAIADGAIPLPVADAAPEASPAAVALDRGTQLFQAGNIVEAEKAYRQASELDPNMAEAQVNLGTALKRLKRPLEALECYRRAVNIRPDWASAYSNLGSALCDLGRQEEAEAACKRAIELDPRHRNAHSNLASVYAASRRDEDAIVYFEKALEIGPPAAELWNNLAVSYLNVGRVADAENACQQAIALQPQFAEAHANLASVYSAQARIREAIDATRNVVKLKPDLQLAWSNLVFNLNYADHLSPQDIFAEHQAWGKLVKDLARTSHDNDRTAGRRIRVGYVSADFCAHSVAFFFKPLIDRHDKSKFEIFCYADVISPDIYTDMIRRASDHWRLTVGLPDADVVKLIEQDRIDILVDLGGHTSKNRMAVFARKPAPLQVTWLGYPNTTGLPAMDYRLVDKVTDPEGDPGSAAVEQLYRLPGGFLCYEAAAGKTPDVGPLPAPASGYVTFGSFNKITKVSEQTVALWSKVLGAVPGSRLVLKSRSFADGSTRERYVALFSKYGIEAGRVDYLDWQPHLRSHLEIYNRIDIALDTMPYNGTTTTCEAMWMGVPVLTLRGNRHAARVGASLNTSLGLSQLIAENDQDFVAKAKALAADLPALGTLRQGLRARMLASPLCDGKRLTDEIEIFFQQIWRDWCGKGQAVVTPAMVPPALALPPAPAKQDLQAAPLRLCMRGDVEISVPNDLSLISPYILLEQDDWFEIEMPFVRSMLRSGDKVLDVGANYGVYTLAAAKAVGAEGKVWSFEPASATAAFLTESLARNGFTNVVFEQAALSHRDGEGQLGLPTGNSEENMLNAPKGPTETVRLRTLDSWATQNDMPDVAFIKLDVEGEEVNVAQGGARFLSTRSPLIMFEVKGAKLNFGLKDHLEQYGYQAYRLVPGLGILAPFRSDETIDEHLLNLFCAKPDRAAQLAARGLLAEHGALPAVSAPAGLWRTAMAKLPFAAGVIEAWSARVAGDDDLARALDLYFYAKDSATPPTHRLAALLRSGEMLDALAAAKPHFAYLSSSARVLADYGRCGAAAHILQRLIPLANRRTVDDSLPLLPAVARFDAVSPGTAFGDWAAGGIFEGRERYATYSSYYGRNSQALLEEARKTGFLGIESERRLQLMRLRRGETVETEALARLTQPAPDNLNAGFWKALQPGKGKAEAKTLLELIPDLPIINVVDIGAMLLGNDVHPYVSLVESGHARVVGFEPNEAECAKLNAQATDARRFYPYFIGDGDDAIYYETNYTMTGSLYKPNNALLDKFSFLPQFKILKAEHKVKTHRLDDLAHLPGLDDIDFFKIDVQGGELNVFKGASRAMASASVIQTEAEFVQLYEGQPLFADVDMFLRGAGYQFHFFRYMEGRCFAPFNFPKSPARGIRQAMWSDAIYVRDFLRLQEVPTGKLLKMAVLLDVIFQSYDLAALALSEVDKRQGSTIAPDYMNILMPRPKPAATG